MSKVVVIIGCATGIGRAAARKWAKEGARLALFDHSDRLRDLVAELSSVTKVLHQIGDITDIGDLESFSHRVFAEYSTIDTVFVNAGIVGKTCYNDPTSIKTLVRTNFFGIVDSVAVFLDHLKAQNCPARIILTAPNRESPTRPETPDTTPLKRPLSPMPRA
jgi:NADP-dependent 3-hydroxy acid dehydrogenase YdfG